MFDSLGGLDSTVGGVAICDAEEAGVVARGVDVFLASGVSVPTHGRLLPVTYTRDIHTVHTDRQTSQCNIILKSNDFTSKTGKLLNFHVCTKLEYLHKLLTV